MSGKKISRRSERALAFQVLYSLSFAPVSTQQELQKLFTSSPDQFDKAARGEEISQGFAWELVQGVWSKLPELDSILHGFSENWRIDRMGKVELTLLRLAIYELVFSQDVPAKVAVNEAIEISKQFGDASSRSFVNGILDAALKSLDAGTLQRQV